MEFENESFDMLRIHDVLQDAAHLRRIFGSPRGIVYGCLHLTKHCEMRVIQHNLKTVTPHTPRLISLDAVSYYAQVHNHLSDFARCGALLRTRRSSVFCINEN